MEHEMRTGILLGCKLFINPRPLLGTSRPCKQRKAAAMQPILCCRDAATKPGGETEPNQGGILCSQTTKHHPTIHPPTTDDPQLEAFQESGFKSLRTTLVRLLLAVFSTGCHAKSSYWNGTRAQETLTNHIVVGKLLTELDIRLANQLTWLKSYGLRKYTANPLPAFLRVKSGIVLNYCQYGVLYLGSYYNTGPYINFPHFGNSNLGKLPSGNPDNKFFSKVIAIMGTLNPLG